MNNCKFCGGEPQFYNIEGSKGYFPGAVGYKCSGSCGQHNDGEYYDEDEDNIEEVIRAAEKKWDLENHKPFISDMSYELISVLKMCRHFMAYTHEANITFLSRETFQDELSRGTDIAIMLAPIDNSQELAAIDAALKQVLQ